MDAGRTADYEIIVAGCLDARWGEWFDRMVVTSDESRGISVLRGRIADQAALHGVLARVRDLGLTLLTVTRIEER